MIASTKPRILDHNGEPLLLARRDRLPLAPQRTRPVRASYDAASSSTEFSNYWAAADAYDADSANSRAVREKLVQRSRYEVWNNGYSDGIAQTYATDLVGVGPRLRMQTNSTGFNQLVELWWSIWAKEIMLRRKLWCQAHAKHVDGEGFGVARTNPGLSNPVKLDYVLYETEQFQSPYTTMFAPGRIDGISFDEYGNAEFYELLRQHPGAANSLQLVTSTERIPARYVMHWFLLRRPGQHRATPECTSTLQVGASSRRWREATVASAETAAEFSVMLKTQFQPDEIDAVSPMSTLEVQKRMMTALPMGWDASQMRAEHPNSTYGEFHKAQINEQARPKSMPYNKAACDSSTYNYASGRLDHQTYYGALDVDREDGNDLVLDPLFAVWFDEAVRVFGWLGGNPAAISPLARLHSWDWPKHPVADVQSEASANDTRLKGGQTTLSRIYAESGLDYEDELATMATDYGVTVDEMRTILLNSIFNSQNQQASMQQAETQAETARQEPTDAQAG